MIKELLALKQEQRGAIGVISCVWGGAVKVGVA